MTDTAQQKLTAANCTVADADRILGLADQFLEDWEDDDGKDAESIANCQERREEYDAVRPLLVKAPALRDALRALLNTVALNLDDQDIRDVAVIDVAHDLLREIDGEKTEEDAAP